MGAAITPASARPAPARGSLPSAAGQVQGRGSEEHAAAQQYLIFSLGRELFAVGTLKVREIIEYRNLTAVPMMPGYIRGVINLRGAVVPVIDLAARFGRPATEAGKRTCIVILEVSGGGATQVLGIVVDAVSAVRQIAASEIEPPPSFGARIRSDFIEGMAKVKDQFVILLDVGRVLSLDEIAALAGLAGTAVE